MTISYKVSNDNGNSEQAIIIGNKLVQQPNVNAKITEVPWTEEHDVKYFIDSLQTQLIVNVNSSAIKKENNGLYYVGHFALNSGEVVNNLQVGIEKKHTSDLPIINTISHIAAIAIQDYYDKHKELPKTTLEIEVDQTTALPVVHHNEETADIFETRFRDNTHEVDVYLGKTPFKVNIVFDFVKAIPEATPVTFSLQKEMNGSARTGSIFRGFIERYRENLPVEFDGRFFKDKTIMHVDIGDGTTGYPITKGYQFLRQFILGSENGVGRAIEEALSEFNESIYVTESSRQFLSDVIKDKSHKYYSRALDALDRPLITQAQQIVRKIKTQLERIKNEVDILVIYGGGSITMRTYLEPLLSELLDEREILFLYIPEEHATLMNVEGLKIFGDSKIFSTLKAKYKENQA